MRKVLVTGATGFIGGHVVELLREKGYDVRGISTSDGDLLDSDFCDREVSGCDTVIHLAWSTSPYSSILDPKNDIATNVNGAISLFQSCLRNGSPKIVFVSSGGTVYGSTDQIPIPESHPILPLSSYGISKSTVERYLHLFHRNDKLSYTVLRGANAYGPGQNFSNGHGVIGQWLNCTAQGKEITVYGDGSNIRDFLYVSDFAEAIANSVEHSEKASTLNIGSGRGHSLMEVIEAIGSITDLNPIIKFDQRRPFDVPSNVLDCTKALVSMNWKPKVDLEEGIRRTWKWMLTQLKSD